MKTLFLTLGVLLVINSCRSYKQKHYYKLTDGKWISKQEFDKSIEDALIDAFRSVPKEDLDLLLESPVQINIHHPLDTLNCK